MYLDAPNPHDAVQIEGEPPLDVVINGGVAGEVMIVFPDIEFAPESVSVQAPVFS